MCSMNTRKSIFFSQTSVRIQLHDTKSFVEYNRFDSLLSQLFIQLGYETYLKLLKLKPTNSLHNLSYVTLFFIVGFTDGIFDSFNRWNHCIF